MKTESAEPTEAAVQATEAPIRAPYGAFFDAASLLLLLGLFGLCCFRAATLPIAHDEGLTYKLHLNGGMLPVLTFTLSNHFLFVLLGKVFLLAFGVRELSFRAPTLVGAALYFAATFLLCRRLFSSPLMRFVAIALLCMNPAILDFLAAGRGYGLGMGCLAVATWAMTGAIERGVESNDQLWRWNCAIAGAFVALAVVANLIFVYPSTALALAFLAVSVRAETGRREFNPSSTSVAALLKYFVAPGVATELFLMWPLLIQVRFGAVANNSGIGQGSAMLRDVFNTSFLYKWTQDFIAPSLGAVPPLPGSWQQRISDAGVYLFFPLVLAAVVFGWIWFSRAASRAPQVKRREGQLLCGAALLTLILIFGFHLALHVNFPFSRECLYFIFFFTLAALMTLNRRGGSLGARALRTAGWIILVVVLGDYALSLHAGEFRYNAFDSISRAMFQSVAADARSRGLQAARGNVPGSVRIGGSWWYEPEMIFYQRRYKATWLGTYDIKFTGWAWQADNPLTPADYDYFICTPDDQLCAPENVAAFGGKPRRVLFFDPATQTTVFAIDR